MAESVMVINKLPEPEYYVVSPTTSQHKIHLFLSDNKEWIKEAPSDPLIQEPTLSHVHFASFHDLRSLVSLCDRSRRTLVHVHTNGYTCYYTSPYNS